MEPSPTLLTDRYQLTMLAAYARTGHADRRAVFELFVRRLPPSRRYLVACGVGRAVEYLRRIRFSSDELAYLAADPVLGPALADPRVRRLFEGLRFQARVLAIPEGRVCFPFEPLIQVEGTLAEAQIVETLLLSVVNHDARVASKCARIVEAAQGRECFEFGARRTHENAAVDAARAAYVAGFAATSNEEAARRYGVPVRGTMAHAYVLTHAADRGEEGELEAFRTFADAFGGSAVCLVDTFDTLRGVDRAIEALGSRLSGVRLDSGDLAALAAGSRERMDRAGLTAAKVVLSDDLDEYKIKALLDGKTPVDAFGVGTMAVSTPDAPSLGAVYKLVALEDDRGRMRAVEKRASGKGSAAGPKQVFRRPGSLEDTVALRGEAVEGEALLVPVFEGGQPVGDLSLEAARRRLRDDLARAEPRLRSLDPRAEDEGFPSRRTERLWQLHQQIERDGNAPLLSGVFMRTILIDVDTQHDFCHPTGALFVLGAERLHEAFRQLTARGVAVGAPIVGSVDSHAFDAWEFADAPEPGPGGERPGFPPHCVKGTEGWLKVPGTLAPRFRFVPNVPLADDLLAPLVTRHQPQQILLEKEVYSLFANPNAGRLLDLVLQGAEGVRFLVYGVALDYCVRAAALGLLDYLQERAVAGEVLLCVDATASVVPAGGERALAECQVRGVKPVSTREALASL